MLSPAVKRKLYYILFNALLICPVMTPIEAEIMHWVPDISESAYFMICPVTMYTPAKISRLVPVYLVLDMYMIGLAWIPILPKPIPKEWVFSGLGFCKMFREMTIMQFMHMVKHLPELVALEFLQIMPEMIPISARVHFRIFCVMMITLNHLLKVRPWVIDPSLRVDWHY